MDWKIKRMTSDSLLSLRKNVRDSQKVEHLLSVLRANKSKIFIRKILKKFMYNTGNKQHHEKVLLKRFHLNGHSLGLHLQT